MEADWSVALAGDDPTIDIPWASFVDLRADPTLIDKIAETQANLPLRAALLALNGAESPFWTAKCDVWTVDEPSDPFEMEAETGEAAFGVGSYIDLIARHLETRASFELQEQWMRRVTAQLRVVSAGAARVDLVLRHAQVDGHSGFGVSWFVQGCGANVEIAEQMWARALRLALPVIQSAG